MANLGVHVYEQATSLSTPVVADAGTGVLSEIGRAHV